MSFLLDAPSPEWEAWAKIILAISVPLLIISGTLFIVAWKGVQIGTGVWRTMMHDFMLTDEFKKAVNDARKPAEWEFEKLMNRTIRDAIKEHVEEWHDRE